MQADDVLACTILLMSRCRMNEHCFPGCAPHKLA